MKLLFIVQKIGKTNGWGRVATEIFNNLTQKIETEVIAEGVNFAFNEKCKTFKSGTGLAALINNLIEFNKIKFRFQRILAVDLWPFGLYAYSLKFFTSSKFYLLGVGTYSVAPLNKKYFGWVFKKIYENAEVVFCISKYTEKRILEFVPNAKTVVVPLGLSKMETIKENEQIISKYGIEESDFPVIVTVGEIKHRKGQFETAQAVMKLKEKFPKIKYLIVGSDRDVSYVDKIKSLDNESKTLKFVNDAKSDEELVALYKRSDVFALNSNNDEVHCHFEGFGLVILEANQFGIPAVGSSGCGIEDAIKDGENGFLTRQGDVSDIVEKMQKILDIKKKDNLFWVSKCKDWSNKFSWEYTVEEYIKYIGK